MIWVFVYMVVMTVAVAALCMAKAAIVGDDGFTGTDEGEYYIGPIVAGVLWPGGLPVYGGYLAARYYIKHQEDGQ